MGDDSDRDRARLQGDWKQVSVAVGGRSHSPSDEYAEAGAITTIDGCRFSVRAADGRLLLTGTFELDASTTPKAITWIDAIGPDAGKRLPASYELEEDRFVFVAADADCPRPLVLEAGPGQVMRAFVRKRG